MRLLIQLIILSILGDIRFESWLPESSTQTVVVRVLPLSWKRVLKYSGKEVIKLPLKFFPNYHSLLLSYSYASNAKYSTQFRQLIWTICNSTTRGDILYGVEQITI
jgi:hypothetical protein